MACLTLAGTCAAFADMSGQQLAQSAGHTLIGAPAPALVLKTIDGKSIDLASLYGRQAVYLKFWATWCVPCRQQMPHFESTFEHEGPHLAVIAVNAGFNDTRDDVEAYRRDVGLRMPIVIDDGRLAEVFHLRVTPQHIVIGRDGRIAYIGHLVDERLESALRTAQEQPPDAQTAHQHPEEQHLLQAGTSVPALQLTALDGHALQLADPAQRRATVVMFISPWCESYLEKSRPQRASACRAAREQSERLSSAGQLRWVAIASGLWATHEDLTRYRETKHVTIPLALDESGSLFREFAVKDVPSFIVISATGTLRGRTDEVSDDLDQRLRSLAEGTPAGGTRADGTAAARTRMRAPSG
ncbi:MAG: redoxin domain-containing protein [Sinobacteraceae bacterium]|nr:redoxin domain-containing protein [Nevskiaceae bacterium]